MENGRLIRLGKYRGDPKAVAYIVAIPDPATAIDLIRTKIGVPDDEIEDLSRVSDALLQALHLSPGEFIRANGRAELRAL